MVMCFPLMDAVRFKQSRSICEKYLNSEREMLSLNLSDERLKRFKKTKDIERKEEEEEVNIIQLRKNS